MLVRPCFSDAPLSTLYAKYHDEEWGVAVHDEHKLFEMLVLEGMQAGLSWELILKKRTHYQRAFHHFDPRKVALLSTKDLEERLQNPHLIRNRLKIFSIQKNAKAFLRIQHEEGSFDAYIWGFVNHTPLINQWQKREEIPCETPLSQKIAKDLKKRGMSFVGPKIIYSFLQAIGIVNDHLISCPRHEHVFPT